MATVWIAFKWFLENFVLILAFIGLCSIIVRVFDALVEKQIAKHPTSKFWVYLDNALDASDSFLGVFLDILHKFALRQKAPADQPEAPPK